MILSYEQVKGTVALIDADILVYKAGFSVEKKVYILNELRFVGKAELMKYAAANNLSMDDEIISTTKEVAPEWQAKANLNSIIKALITRIEPKEMRFFLTKENDVDNFRKRLLPTYKESRKKLEKPVHYQALREYLIEEYSAEVVEDMEADDMLALSQTEETIICSVDKDLLMIPGYHYNLTDHSVHSVDEWGELRLNEESGKRILRGSGLLWFYAQLVMGDGVDSVPPLKSKFKDVKTFDLLSWCTSEDEIVTTLMEWILDNEIPFERVHQQAQLIWMTRPAHVPLPAIFRYVAENKKHEISVSKE